MAQRGKCIAMVACGTAIAVLASATFLLRHEMFEHWCLFRLESSDKEIELWAATRLGEMRSVRAVEPLVQRLVRAASKEWTVSGILGSRFAKSAPAPIILRNDEFETYSRVLLNIGKPAIPCLALAVVDALDRGGDEISFIPTGVLWSVSESILGEQVIQEITKQCHAEVGAKSIQRCIARTALRLLLADPTTQRETRRAAENALRTLE